MFVGAFVAEKVDSVHTHALVCPNVSAIQSASGARSVRSAGSSMDKTGLLGVPVRNNCRDLWCTTSKIFRIIENKRESRLRIIYKPLRKDVYADAKNDMTTRF